MRELRDIGRVGIRAAILAVDVYLHRLRAKIAAMTAATDGTNAVVFTAGVGENSDEYGQPPASTSSGSVLRRRQGEPVGRSRRPRHQPIWCGSRTLVIDARGACGCSRVQSSFELPNLERLNLSRSTRQDRQSLSAILAWAPSQDRQTRETNKATDASQHYAPTVAAWRTPSSDNIGD